MLERTFAKDYAEDDSFRRVMKAADEAIDAPGMDCDTQETIMRCAIMFASYESVFQGLCGPVGKKE